MKPEDKLQHKIVMEFSHKHPEFRGCLWAVFNENSKHKKALGMFDGASDLQIFANGIFAGIEVKAPESYHKITHIKRQLEWGRNVIENKGLYLMCSNFHTIMDFIESVVKYGWDFAETTQKIMMRNIERKIEEAEEKGLKTIKFE
jgi:hypothetical protein